MATEGVGDAGDVARSQAVQQLFSPQQFGTFAGNQGRALAQQQQLTEGRAQQMAGFEGQLAQQDIQIRQQGRSGAAQTQAQQQQIQAQQDAAIEGAELQYQAERDRRRQQLMGTALGIGGAVLTTPFGEEGATLGGNLIQSLFGGGEDTSQAQEMIEGQQQFSDMMGGIGQLQDGTDQMAGMIDQSQQFTGMTEGIGNIPLPSGYQPLGEQAVAQPSQQELDYTANVFGDMGGSRDETVEQMFSAANVGDVQEMRDYLTTDEGQMETFGIDRQESQQQIAQMLGEASEEDLGMSREEAEQMFEDPEFQQEFYRELSMSGGDAELGQRFSGLITGHDARGRRYEHSLADVLQSPFIMAGRGFSAFRNAVERRNQRLREEAIQQIQQR